MRTIILLLVIFLCSCASKPIQIAVDIPMPAEINISNYATVAVVPIQGQVAKNAALKLNANIVQSKLCSVINDINSRELIEQNLKMTSDAYSAESISNLGKMIKADAIIFVDSAEVFDDEQVTEETLPPDFSDDPYASQISSTNFRIAGLNNDYQSGINNLNTMSMTGQYTPQQINTAKLALTTEYTRQYKAYEEQQDELQRKQADYKQKKIDDKRIQYTRAGNLLIDMSFIFTNAKTGEILVSKQYSEKEFFQTQAINREPSRINPLPKYNPITEKMTKNYSDAILPHTSTAYIWVEVVDHPDFDRGMAFFRNQSWNEAITIFRSIYNNFNSDPELQSDTEELAKSYYNYGLALCLSLDIQNIENSISILKKAYFMNPKSFYNEILSFSKNRKEQLLKLQSQTGQGYNLD